MSYVLLSLSLGMFRVAQALTSQFSILHHNSMLKRLHGSAETAVCHVTFSLNIGTTIRTHFSGISFSL